MRSALRMRTGKSDANCHPQYRRAICRCTSTQRLKIADYLLSGTPSGLCLRPFRGSFNGLALLCKRICEAEVGVSVIRIECQRIAELNDSVVYLAAGQQ